MLAWILHTIIYPVKCSTSINNVQLRDSLLIIFVIWLQILQISFSEFVTRVMKQNRWRRTSAKISQRLSAMRISRELQIWGNLSFIDKIDIDFNVQNNIFGICFKIGQDFEHSHICESCLCLLWNWSSKKIGKINDQFHKNW